MRTLRVPVPPSLALLDPLGGLQAVLKQVRLAMMSSVAGQFGGLSPDLTQQVIEEAALCPAGEKRFLKAIQEVLVVVFPIAGVPLNRADLLTATPCWDWTRRELRLGDQLVKRDVQEAPQQWLILDAFEEEGWPYRSDSPLTPSRTRNPKRHLLDMIENLNRARCQPLIRFHGDGSGKGIFWERCLG